MNVDTKTYCAATYLVDDNRPLKRALREWFHRKGSCPDPEIVNFWDWVCNRLDDAARGFPATMLVEDWRLVKALEVNAIGDRLAVKEAKRVARRRGFQSDTNCYVEDGEVNASVWIKGTTAEAAEADAEKVAERFRGKGYAVDLWIDEEDATEVTVNATIDFAAYVKPSKKGGL